MAILKIRNTTGLIVLSDPEGGQVTKVAAGNDKDVVVSMALIERIQDQIQAYADGGFMTYTVENNPDIPDDLEAAALDAAAYLGNSVRYGMAVTPTTWDMAVAAGEAYVNGVFHLEAGQTVDGDGAPSMDLAGTSPVPAGNLPSGDYEAVSAKLLLVDVAGTPTWKVVFGAKATDGAAVPTPVEPTAAQITSALGDNGNWFIVADILGEYDGSLTVTATDVRSTPASTA